MNSYEALGRMITDHGLPKTQRALLHLWTASVVVSATGETPTVERISTYWKQSERTTLREQKAWREITGGLEVGPVARRVVAERAIATGTKVAKRRLFGLADLVPMGT